MSAMADNEGSKVVSDSSGDNEGYWPFQHDDWVISTRYVHHVCHDIGLLKNVRCVQGFTVTMANGVTYPALKMGDADLNGVMNLENVLYVPEYRVNVVSVSALIGCTGLVVEFRPDEAVIKEMKSKKTICIGRQVAGLYVIGSSLEEKRQPEPSSVGMFFAI